MKGISRLWAPRLSLQMSNILQEAGNDWREVNLKYISAENWEHFLNISLPMDASEAQDLSLDDLTRYLFAS